MSKAFYATLALIFLAFAVYETCLNLALRALPIGVCYPVKTNVPPRAIQFYIPPKVTA